MSNYLQKSRGIIAGFWSNQFRTFEKRKKNYTDSLIEWIVNSMMKRRINILCCLFISDGVESVVECNK